MKPRRSSKLRPWLRRVCGKADRIPGGRAAGRRSDDFDARQLRRGIAVELEHTRSQRVACEIAMDHLAEDRAYYRKLAKIHRER